MSKDSSKIKFLDDIAISDTAFEVKGKTPNELFENAGKALVRSMANIAKISRDKKHKIQLKSKSLDILLFDFLNELLFIKDTENLLFSDFKVDIIENETFMLEGTLTGEKINSAKHEISTDIKAVTLHMFELEKNEGEYRARVVVDI